MYNITYFYDFLLGLLGGCEILESSRFRLHIEKIIRLVVINHLSCLTLNSEIRIENDAKLYKFGAELRIQNV